MATITPLGDAGGKWVATGLLFTGEYPVVTTDDPDLALVHAQLYMNHMRSFAALSSWIAAPSDVVVYQGSLSDIGGDDFEPSDLDVLATWGLPPGSTSMGNYAQELRFEWEGVERNTPLPWDSMLRPPVPDLVVDEDTRKEAWEAAEERLGELAPIVHGITETAAPQLEHTSQDFGVLEGLFCVLLATEQQIAEDETGNHVDDPAWLQEHMALFFREIAAQEALLALEYLDVIVAHLSQPDVDWLRTPDVDLSQDMTDGSTSTTEFVFLWLNAAETTLSGSSELLTMANT
jgi:hypothetical protein